MKPDLGLLHLQKGLDAADATFFYGVEFIDIDFVSRDLCSVMFEYPWGEKEELYALSFDFGHKILKQLLEKLPESEMSQFIDSNNKRSIPFRATLPRPVTADVVECRLGKLQIVEAEQFIPFIIK